MTRDYITAIINARDSAELGDALCELSNASPDERVAALQCAKVTLPADQYGQIVEAIPPPEDFPYGS